MPEITGARTYVGTAWTGSVTATSTSCVILANCTTTGTGGVCDNYRILHAAGVASATATTNGHMYTTNTDYITDSATWHFASNTPASIDPMVLWQQREAKKKEQHQKDLAVFRSMRLLLSMLTDEQTESLEANGWFELVGADNRKYRLLYHRHGNVLRLNDDHTIETGWCGHLGADLPVADTLVGQKLMIEFDPLMYTEKSNVVSKHACETLSLPYGNFADHVAIGKGEEPLPPDPEPEPEPEPAPLLVDPTPGFVEPELVAV